MKIYLDNRNDINELICLDIDTGRFSELIKDDEMTHPVNGIGSQIGDLGNNICAVYVYNNCIWLQFNTYKWNILKDKIFIKYRRFLFFEFIKIFNNNKTVLKKAIKSYKSFMNLLSDPTTDSIDEVNEYFLLWLSKILNNESWAESFKKKYGSAGGQADLSNF